MNRREKSENKEAYRDQEHNYEVREFYQGFAIIPIEKDAEIIYASLNEYGFWELSTHMGLRIDMYSFYNLLEFIAEELYKNRENKRLSLPHSGWMTEDEAIEYAKGERIKNWAKGNTAKTLAKPVRDAWRNVIERQPSKRLCTLHKKLFSASAGTKGSYGISQSQIAQLISKDKENPYLINDIINYRCAAQIFVKFAGSRYGRYDGFERFTKDWKSMFGNMRYSTMRKTMSNYPGGIPMMYVGCFSDFDLPEPATTRIRYLAYGVCADNNSASNTGETVEMIKRSSDEDIKKAVRMVWDELKWDVKSGFKSAKYICQALYYIYDYADNNPLGNWDIVGVCKRSIAWHKDAEKRYNEMRAKQLKKRGIYPHSKTAVPPIPLPKTKAIRFLDTYSAVLEESQRMKHCIDSYAVKAIEGDSYLFHIDYDGEEASAEVSPRGFVVQAFGYLNSENKASAYAKKSLGGWAKRLVGATRSANKEWEPEIVNVNADVCIPEFNFVDEEVPF